MLRQLFFLLAIGLALGGCSRCGFWWDDLRDVVPKSCKVDEPRK
jgi:hypothetical protein